MSADHVVFDYTKQILICKHCGRSHPLRLPLSVEQVAGMSKAWSEPHKRCKGPVAKLPPAPKGN